MKTLQIILLSFFSTSLINFLGTSAVPADYFPAESPGEITFIGNAGSDQVFTIENWKFNEISMPDHDPTQLQLVAEMDINSITTGWTDLLNNVKNKKDYFFVKKFPTASLHLDGATLLEDGRYQSEAELELKGVRKPVTITFQISKDAPFQVEAEAIVMRRMFKFTGNGPADEVPVNIKAELPF